MLDTTVNPDFSQVESDEPQVTTNQRFEVSFRRSGRFSLRMPAIFRRRSTWCSRGALRILTSEFASPANKALMRSVRCSQTIGLRDALYLTTIRRGFSRSICDCSRQS